MDYNINRIGNSVKGMVFMKLKRFNKDRELNQLKSKTRREYNVKNRTLVLSVMILILSVIYFTFARYESNSADFTIVNATVGEFSTSDIKITSYMYDDGSGTITSHKNPPLKNSGYKFSSANCSNANASWDVGDWGLVITDITGRVDCVVNMDRVVNTSDLIQYDRLYYSTSGNEGVISNWIVAIEGDEPKLISEQPSPNTFTINPSQSNYLNYVKILNDEAKSYPIDSNFIKDIYHADGSSSNETCSSIASCDGNFMDVGIYIEDTYFQDSASSNWWVAKRYKSFAIDDSQADYGGFYRGSNNGQVILYSNNSNTSSGTYSIRPMIQLKSNVAISYDNTLQAFVFSH